MDAVLLALVVVGEALTKALVVAADVVFPGGKVLILVESPEGGLAIEVTAVRVVPRTVIPGWLRGCKP